VFRRATTKLGFGEGDACLKLLTSLPGAPPGSLAEAIETLRANCTMKAGDCLRGRALLEAVGKRHGWDAPRMKATLDDSDHTYCPLDAPPRAEWPARAKHRLLLASASNRSCKPTLEFLRKHDLGDNYYKFEIHMFETHCHLKDKNCTAARAAIRQAFIYNDPDPARRPNRIRDADAALAQLAPHCR
jgi:hypothetical protein